MSSNDSINQPKEKLHPNRRLASYVTGFILSLVFTLIPYYLVKNEILHNNVLIGVILGFAVFQLIIQLVFFLHLGRDQKTRWNLVFMVNTLGIILVVTGASVWIMSHLRHNMQGLDIANKISSDEAVYQVDGKQTGTCPGNTGKNYDVVLNYGIASPTTIIAKLCDTITIVNKDKASHDISFSDENQLPDYAGQTGGSIRPGKNLQITLTKLGTYTFHDPTHSIQATFVVNN